MGFRPPAFPQAALKRGDEVAACTKYLLIAADVPAMAQIVGATARMPYLGLKLLLDLGDVSEVVAQMNTARQPVATARALAVGKLDTALIQSVCRLVDILDSPQDAVVLSPLLRYVRLTIVF